MVVPAEAPVETATKSATSLKTAIPPQSSSSFRARLAILSEVRSAQAAHGLKLGADFLRYRQYLTRRLGRTRRATHLQNGRGRYSATAVTCTHVGKNTRALEIPLFQAERAWAFAMDVKREQPSGAARARRTVISKLSKAVVHAEALRALCKECADPETVLEAEAYARWMTATLALEREQWGDAHVEFELAHKIYDGMAGVHGGSAKGGMFEERMEEIAQAMRFCKYNLARDGAAGDAHDDATVLQGLRRDAGSTTDDVLAEKIEAALAAARKKSAMSFGEVHWCGRDIPLRSERVREAVLAANEEGAALKNSTTDNATVDGAKVHDVDAYDKVFMAYNDASRVVNKELAEFRVSSSTRADERVEELEALLAYLSYGRLQHTAERNSILIAALRSRTKAARAEDFVRIHDNLVQNYSDMLALHGVDTDAVLCKRLESARTLHRAHKCFYLARAYLSASRQGEAAVLFDRVSELSTQVSTEHKEEAEGIVRDGASLKCRAQAQAFLKDALVLKRFEKVGLDSGEVGKKKMIMTEHLDEFISFAEDGSGVRRIAQVPPALEAVPCKPVLFDLAVDAIPFPVEKEEERKKKEEAAAKEKEEQAKPAKDGLSTRFGRWWSGKG